MWPFTVISSSACALHADRQLTIEKIRLYFTKNEKRMVHGAKSMATIFYSIYALCSLSYAQQMNLFLKADSEKQYENGNPSWKCAKDCAIH